MTSISFPSLAADIQQQLGLTVLRDIAFDAVTGRLTATRMGADGSESRLLLNIDADDRDRLAQAAGNRSVKTELRAIGQGNIGLVLLNWQGGTAWAHGAMFDLGTPAFALEKLATRSRLTELGKQCAAVAHEIRQPLFTIAMASENLRLCLASQPGLQAEAVAALDHIQEEVERARAILNQTLDYAAGRASGKASAQGDTGLPPRADLAHAVTHAIRLLSYQMERSEIAMELNPFDEPLPVVMPQIELEQIVLNVLRNAIESIEARKAAGWAGQGLIRLDLSAGQRLLRCTISDNGAGLGGTEPESGFQPFVTTKGEDGNGLGLYICEQLLGKAGGGMRLLPGDREGAKVELALPLRGPADSIFCKG